MHAFVPPVLLGVGGLDQLQIDPEPHPPHGELGEPPQRAAREGHAVVGADDRGKAVLVEESPEDGTRGGEGWAGEALAAEEVAAVAVGHGERVAVLAVAGFELPFEVRGPDRGLSPAGMW